MKVLAAAVLIVASTAGTATAQTAERARTEVSGGLRWIGPLSFGGVAANEATAGGGSRPLFDSRTSLAGSPGATAAVGVRVSRMVRVEGSITFNRTRLRTLVENDTEGIADVTITAPVTQFLLEGGVIAQPSQWRIGPVLPFIEGGLGYLRQLNDGRTLVETGRSYYAGAGLYYVRASSHPGRVKATGFRADVRAQIMRDGVAPDSDARPAAALTASVFARF